jgi:DNA/RNA-binding domain of Phe-tRNA-synthetase-like protein
VQLVQERHPLLSICAFACNFPEPLARTALPQAATWLSATSLPGLDPADDAVRAAIRDMLRQRGYKPTGRGKPASEYLARARADGSLRPINAAVDACNAVSLHSGLPISVVDRDALNEALQIRTAEPGDSYVFNATGQRIELAGLPCLFDAEGPCANAVKDAQRTKTSERTERTLSAIWSSQQLQARSEAALALYCTLLRSCGAQIELIAPLAATE